MALTFDPISSPGATRDLLVDLSGALEDDETLTLASISSSYPAALAVSNVSINGAVVEFGEQQIAVGKGVQFTIQTMQESRAAVPLILSIEGDSGTIDKYELSQPLTNVLSD